MAVDGEQPTIFVSIPSYRDPECQYTIVDLFRKARHPERLRVGVCWQADREEDVACFRLDLDEFLDRVRTVFLHYSEARGPCYARALIQQKLFRGEDFYFQLDSHYRMVRHWDEELVTQHGWCPSEKAILTTYPSSYTLPEDYAPGGPDRAVLHPNTHPVIVCAREFGADGFLRTTGKAVRAERLGGSPADGLFWAAGFAFSRGAVVEEVPYDAALEDLFFGEEQAMAARLWSSGWDFYAPTKVIGYHLWTRKHRPIFRENACDAQRRRERASQAAVRRLLGAPQDGDAEGVGHLELGGVRSLEEFEKFCGVSMAKRKLTLRARRGGVKYDAFVDGDPAAQPTPSAASGAGPAGALPILGLMPGNVAATIQALAGGPAPAVAQPTGPLPGPPPRLLSVAADCASRLLTAAEARALNDAGVVVVDGFLRRGYAALGAERAAEAPRVVRAAAGRVAMRPARLGRGGGMWSSAAVRGDEMTWLSVPEGEGLRERAARRAERGLAGGQDEFAALETQLRGAFGEAGRGGVVGGQDIGAEVPEGARAEDYEDLDVYLAKVVELRGELDAALGFGCARTSAMMARYPGGGAHYARHLDVAPGQAGERRRLTLVYYLNEGWAPGDGGCLRAYLPPDVGPGVQGARRCSEDGLPEGSYVLDVEPLMDRLVVFASGWLEHEVLPAHADRYAITTWLY